MPPWVWAPPPKPSLWREDGRPAGGLVVTGLSSSLGRRRRPALRLVSRTAAPTRPGAGGHDARHRPPGSGRLVRPPGDRPEHDARGPARRRSRDLRALAAIRAVDLPRRPRRLPTPLVPAANLAGLDDPSLAPRSAPPPPHAGQHVADGPSPALRWPAGLRGFCRVLHPEPRPDLLARRPRAVALTKRGGRCVAPPRTPRSLRRSEFGSARSPLPIAYMKQIGSQSTAIPGHRVAP